MVGFFAVTIRAFHVGTYIQPECDHIAKLK